MKPRVENCGDNVRMTAKVHVTDGGRVGGVALANKPENLWRSDDGSSATTGLQCLA